MRFFALFPFTSYLCLLSPLASAQDAELVADAKKEGKVVDIDELDTAGFAEKRKEYRKIFFH
jgi:hypothetical protein